MKQYTKAVPLIFIHTPKTAGTTVKRIVKKWFKSNFHQHYYDEIKDEKPPKIDLRGLHQPRKPLALYGHFNSLRGFGVEDYYPEERQCMTILRDPLELTISDYYYTKKHATGWKRRMPSFDYDNLAEFITATSSINMLNHFPRKVTIENYKDIIEEYFLYIGITEDLNKTVLNMASCLGLPKPKEIGYENKSARDADLPESAREAFMEKHQLEFTVYEYVKELHASFKAKPPQGTFFQVLSNLTKFKNK